MLSWRYSNLSARDLRAKAELALIRESQCDADIERCFKKVCPVKSDDGVWITCGRVSSGQLIVTGLLASNSKTSLLATRKSWIYSNYSQ